MNQQRKALTAAFASVAAASFSAIFIRIAIAHGVNPVVLAFWRLFLTCLFMLPYTLSQKCYRTELGHLNRPKRFLIFVSGFLLALHFGSWFLSLKYTSTVSSTLLVCTEPVFVLIGAYFFFKEKPCSKSYPGLIIALFGLILVAWPEAGGSQTAFSGNVLLGNLLALFGAISVAGYVLVGRAILANTSTIMYSTFVYTVCCVVLGLLTIIMGFSLADISGIGLLMAGCLALICQLFGHTVCNWALKYTKAANVSSIYLLEPVGTAIWVFVLWRDIPAMTVIAGGTLLLLGIFYFIRCEAKAEDALEKQLPT
jgi:drug/metabolite transporter (DMT)-like permease